MLADCETLRMSQKIDCLALYTVYTLLFNGFLPYIPQKDPQIVNIKFRGPEMVGLLLYLSFGFI